MYFWHHDLPTKLVQHDLMVNLETGIQKLKDLPLRLLSYVFFISCYVILANGGGSGGRIAVYLSEYMLFNGDLVATGGSAVYPGGPGTVFVQTDVGNDRWRELWINNLGRGEGNSCDYPTRIDNDVLNAIHLYNRACAIPTKVSEYINKKRKYMRCSHIIKDLSTICLSLVYLFFL